ncbi:serpin-z3 [Phtheirospermum japonicum]|uniref:Serpin-z3 n=1 Tax=Phtheirospermum japonicum TaxID=374723 RepID=A0A830BP97_9LAMI|nr:serpin-z3 [Phtheirospermum japonicum]
MVDSSSLLISKFIHKASIEVDEQGTEAAAASACLMAEICSMFKPKKLDFVADHPFLFVIRENVSGGVLFVGQLVNPLSP